MRTLLLFIVIGILTGCTAMAEQPQHPTSGDQQGQDLNFAATVIWVELEGGFYGLEDEQGRHYLPDSIPGTLRKEGQPVRVKAHPAPPSVGFRMWGQRIIVEEMSAR